MTGITKERMQKTLQQEKSITPEDYAKVKALASMIKMPRSFIFKNPDEYGMTGWHDLSIPSDDGTPLEAWYIPAKGGESTNLSSSTMPFPCAVLAILDIWANRGVTSSRPLRLISSSSTST